MTLVPFSLVWLAMACITLGLALYRKVVTRNEDDYLHVHETDAPVVARQFEIARRVDAVDRWGKLFTVLTVAFGIVLVAIYVYQTWTTSLQTNF